MKRSFRRLMSRSVLTVWAVGLVLLFAYRLTLSWTEEQAERDGVFLAHALLDATPPTERAARIASLRPSFWVGLDLVPVSDVEARIGRRPSPGERIRYVEMLPAEWYYVAFADGEHALAAGPVNPAFPVKVLPIGLLIAVLVVPIIASLVAIRVERELVKVEDATDAFTKGDLSARVDNPSGPSSELAASFNRMAERLEEAIKSRDELVQAVSHELGSPLSRLRFHVELLEQVLPADPEARFAGMTQELDALEDLVAELLGFVQSDFAELERRAFDPKQGILHLAELTAFEGPDPRRAEVEVEVVVPAGLRLLADERAFGRAVENVLRNAMRHARGRVRVELIAKGHQARVTVHDDGPGIPAPMREKVLLPFVRLEPARDRRAGGVGLGLALVDRIVRRHGGRLEIGDSPLGGAMVTTEWTLA